MSNSAFKRDNQRKRADERRLTVNVDRDENGRDEIIVRDLNFNETVGWYAQKSLRLSPEEVDVLIRRLAAHRSTLRKRSSAQRPATHKSETPTILRFPTIDSDS